LITSEEEYIMQLEYKIVEHNNRNLDYMKAMAEMLKELNEELKEEKYSEQEINKMYKYYEREEN
jgi:hypothetical protein